MQHYLWLVVFTWMVVEAVQMYLKLVRVFDAHISHYMVKYNLAAWGKWYFVFLFICDLWPCFSYDLTLKITNCLQLPQSFFWKYIKSLLEMLISLTNLYFYSRNPFTNTVHRILCFHEDIYSGRHNIHRPRLFGWHDVLYQAWKCVFFHSLSGTHRFGSPC